MKKKMLMKKKKRKEGEKQAKKKQELDDGLDMMKRKIGKKTSHWQMDERSRDVLRWESLVCAKLHEDVGDDDDENEMMMSKKMLRSNLKVWHR